MAYVRKYPRDFYRRAFLTRLSSGFLSCGLLSPLWQAMASTGSSESAYPDELLSTDELTGGKISPGQKIDASNVELVKGLLDPIQYIQIRDMGRTLRVVESEHDFMKLGPWEYQEATLRNQGLARFDEVGNVVTVDGMPWVGGNPFPDAKTAEQVFAAATLSWGRHDATFNATKEYDLNPEGKVAYRYDSCWAEFATVSRLVLDPKPYLPEHKDKLRFQTVFFLTPNDVKGTSFLNIWHYDQRRFPDLYGYIPAFKRVRRYPANQRFEPLIPGSSLYLSDAWATGDPYLTWGNYRIVHIGPGLGAISGNWNSSDENWENETHGGPNGDSFWNMNVELIPEVIVIEAEPVRYPRAPVSKKRVWFDARTLLPISMVSFDRRGDIFRSFDGGFSLYEADNSVLMDGDHPYWSWTKVHAHNIQTNRLTRIEQVKKVAGGYETAVNDSMIYTRYMTVSALRRLGT